MKKSLKLALKPEWDEVENARNASIHFLKSNELSNDRVQTFSMVISELIENSIKYGNFKPPENKVIVNIEIRKNIMTVEVINSIGETDYENLNRLDKMIQWIRGYQDPFEAYVNKIEEVSKRHLNDTESGLGLARIAYEGRAIIDFFLYENNMLNVSAVSNID